MGFMKLVTPPKIFENMVSLTYSFLSDIAGLRGF